MIIVKSNPAIITTSLVLSMFLDGLKMVQAVERWASAFDEEAQTARASHLRSQMIWMSTGVNRKLYYKKIFIAQSDRLGVQMSPM